MLWKAVMRSLDGLASGCLDDMVYVFRTALWILSRFDITSLRGAQ